MSGVAWEHLWGSLSSLSRCAILLKKTYSKMGISSKNHVVVGRLLGGKVERGYRLVVCTV